jgi:bifunctional ADP-heptose synthase (sugar kinase/adenylyltransferase)
LKILVVGDHIEDQYLFGTATRLCPEAPVPIIVPTESDRRFGGAGLVWNQLHGLSEDHICYWWGSWSRKQRYYAGPHLVCRIDNDSIGTPSFPFPRWNDGNLRADAFVVCDYSKGAMTPELARKIVDTGKPCFVDAKNHWPWYEGPNVTIFPNSREAQPAPEHIDPAKVMRESQFKMIVHKLGDRGCRLQDGKLDITLPASVGHIVDCCGAGDIFMAAFVYAWSIQLPIIDCLSFANKLAGESCRHLGTYVVPKEFANATLGALTR